MRHRVVLVTTDVSEKNIAFVIRMTKIGELGNTLAELATEHSARSVGS
jgi:hypothetical protein